MKNINKDKNQNLNHLHFNTFLKASPEAMDALLSTEADEAIVQRRLPTLELAPQRSNHFLSSSNRALHF